MKPWAETLKELHAKYQGSTTPISDLNLLYPPFAKRVGAMLGDCNAQGLNVRVYETFRTDALQSAYFKRGASKIKTRGMHGFGMAVDIIHATRLWDAPSSFWKNLRAIAAAHDLHTPFTWDLPHIQAVPVAGQSAIRAGKFPWDDEPDNVLTPAQMAVVDVKVIPALKTLYEYAPKIGLSADDSTSVLSNLNEINRILVSAGLKK